MEYPIKKKHHYITYIMESHKIPWFQITTNQTIFGPSNLTPLDTLENTATRDDWS